MVKFISLSDIPLVVKHKIVQFENPNSDYAKKLIAMGFVEGTIVERTSAMIQDPIIYFLRNVRIALRSDEAKTIYVESMS